MSGGSLMYFYYSLEMFNQMMATAGNDFINCSIRMYNIICLCVHCFGFTDVRIFFNNHHSRDVTFPKVRFCVPVPNLCCLHILYMVVS